MWSSPKQNKNWLKRGTVKQTGVGKIRWKTNLVPKTKKKKTMPPLGTSHNLSPKVCFENWKQSNYKTNREALTVFCSIVKHLTL